MKNGEGISNRFYVTGDIKFASVINWKIYCGIRMSRSCSHVFIHSNVNLFGSLAFCYFSPPCLFWEIFNFLWFSVKYVQRMCCHICGFESNWNFWFETICYRQRWYNKQTMRSSWRFFYMESYVETGEVIDFVLNINSMQHFQQNKQQIKDLPVCKVSILIAEALKPFNEWNFTSYKLSISVHAHNPHVLCSYHITARKQSCNSQWIHFNSKSLAQRSYISLRIVHTFT